MAMLIAEDLLLLLLDDESGKLTNSTYLDTGIGGALLVELALGGHVEVVKGSGMWARAKVHPTTRPVRPTRSWSRHSSSSPRRSAPRRTSSAGWARSAASRSWRDSRPTGSCAGRRTPCSDCSRGAAGRRSTAATRPTYAASSVTPWSAVSTPTRRTAALVALLSSLDLAHKVVDREGLPARELKKRAKQIADGDWAAKAVRDAVAAAQAAITAGVVAATSVATTSG